MTILISLEGCDGVGKSTQCKKINHYLHHKIPDEFILTSESNYDEFGKNIFKINTSFHLEPKTQILLWNALRLEHWLSNIKPLDKKIVIYDRFIHSTLVYQGLMHGIDTNLIINLHKQLNLPMPDLTFLLIADENILLKRIHRRKIKDIYDNTSIKTIIARQKYFLQLAEKESDKFIVIDTGKCNNHEVTKIIIETLNKIISKI